MRDDDPNHNAEKALWQSVLILAVDDALLGANAQAAHHHNGQIGKRGLTLVAKRIAATNAARHYLTTPSRDFAMVCTLAGLDPEAVMDRMRKRIAAAPSVEELASKVRVPTLTFDGETLPVKEWAARIGVSPQVIYGRLYTSGWPLRKALTTPAAGKRHGAGATNALRQGKRKPPSDCRGSMPEDADTTNTTSTRPKNAVQLFTHEGETLTLAQWAKRLGVRKNTLQVRLARGWSFERTITTPFAQPRTGESKEQSA